MAQYIKKSALLVEIERLKDELKASDSAAYVEAYIIGAEHTIKTISDVIDTLEVKEVDLDRKMQAFALLYLEPLKISDSNIGISITMSQLYSCAKYFFELGLSVNIKA